MKRLRTALEKAIAAIVLAPVHAYRKLISPLTPARCKYYPSCSRYAVDAVREVGVARGAILAAWRLARCNPWSKGGVDPIEERPFFRDGHRHRHDTTGRAKWSPR